MIKTNLKGFVGAFAVVFALVFTMSLLLGETSLLMAGLNALIFAVIFTGAYQLMAYQTSLRKEADHAPPATTPPESTTISGEFPNTQASKDSDNRLALDDEFVADERAKEAKSESVATPGGFAGDYLEQEEVDMRRQASEIAEKERSKPQRDEPTHVPTPPPPIPVTSTEDILVDPSKPTLSEQGPVREEVAEDLKRASQPEPHPELAEEVQFTLYHPREVAPSKWYTLLTYVHIFEALEQVQQDAHKFRAEMAHDPRQVKSRQTAKLMRGTELRLVPSAEGLEFNPLELKLVWLEDYHRANFRLKADADRVGEPIMGEVAVYVGPLEIATIRFSIFVTDTPAEGQDENQQAVQAAMYKRIFASYSHRDTTIVKACVAAFKAIGYDVLIDYETLRSGEIWSEGLEYMIDEADIFQLFWSPNAAESKYVRQEWERALNRTYGKAPGEGFIRPVYWLQPMPDVPSELGHLHFKFMAELANLNTE